MDNKKDSLQESIFSFNLSLSLKFIGIAIVALIFLMFPIFFDSYTLGELGNVGDFFGGIMNPIVAIAAAFLTFLAFYVQYQANKQVQEQFEKQETREYKINFESKFFELIKIHRDNVSEQNYTKYDNDGMTTAVGRKVFRIMHRELEECINEVLRYRKMYTNDFITPKYRLKLEKIKTNNNLKIDIEYLALIDLAYTIFFFGLGKESEDYLLNSFSGKYDYLFFKRLIKFLQLKSKKENINEYQTWLKLYELPIKELKILIDEIYRNRAKLNYSYHFNHRNLIDNYKKMKYYGGHQHRLGHYFRHLFQTYKYLSLDEKLDDNDKYFYGKTLRGQISTYEQSIFFINSLSSLGQKWELLPEKDPKKEKILTLISDFNIIKNVPGNKFLDIVYYNIYPRVEFENARLKYQKK
jgi:hypothetical protein